MTSGTRSGSGKIVYEFYDRLIGIWGGSANTAPLSFGVSGGDININNKENEDEDSDELSQFEEISDTPVRQKNGKKRKNAVPRLVDQKNKKFRKKYVICPKRPPSY